MDVLTFDGHQDYYGHSDPHIFLNWLQCMDIYFSRYPLSEAKKVKFAITKLTGQAGQFWTNLVKRHVKCNQKPIDTWGRMKDELKGKYVSPHFYKFRPLTSVQPHRSNTLSSPPVVFTLSNQTLTFQPTLDDVMDKINNLLQIMNYSNKNSKSSALCVIHTVREVKEKSENNKSKNTKKDYFKICPITKCYKCQGYGHAAINCPSPFKIAINNRVLIETLSLIVVFLRKSLL